MQLVELVVQGIRRFVSSQKLSFQPGLNVVVGPNESGKTTLADCIRSLLYPQSAESNTSLVGWESPQLCRAALTLRTADGEVFRAIRDLVGGGCTLARSNPESGKFEAVESGSAAVENRLAQLGLPSLKVFDAICCLSGDRLLTGGGSAAPSSAASEGAGSFFPGAAVDLAPERASPEEARRRIEELRAELSGAEALEKLQFELDGIEGKKFNLENQIKALAEIENQISQAKGELRQFEGVDGVGDEMEIRLEKFAKASETHARDRNQFEDRKLAIEGEVQLAQAGLEPVYKNKIVLVGAGVSLLSIVLALAVYNKLIFLLLVGLAVGGVGFYLWNEKAVKVKRLEEKLTKMVQQQAEAERRFEVDTAVVQELLKKLDVTNVGEILDRRKGAKKIEKRLADLEGELARKREAPEIKKAREALGEIETKAAALNEKIAAYGGLSMDPAQIRQEIGRIEGDLAGTSSPGAAPLGGMPGALAGSPSAMTPDSSGAGVGVLLAAAGTATGMGAETLAATEQGRLLSRLGAFTGGRHPGGSFEDGVFRFAGPAGAPALGWSDLSGSTRIAAYLSLALGASELLDGPLLFVWDDVLARFDESRTGAIASALKELLAGRGGQAIWLTSRKDAGAAADHLIRLGQ